MDGVVRKILTEVAEVILGLLWWTNKLFWTWATALMSESKYFPMGSRVFEDETGIWNATHWGLRVIHIPFPSFSLCDEHQGRHPDMRKGAMQ